MLALLWSSNSIKSRHQGECTSSDDSDNHDDDDDGDD